MLIDDNLVSVKASDGGPADLTGTSTLTTTAVPLTSLLKPGREEPIPVHIIVAEDATGGTSITVGFSQSDSETGTFNAVGPTWTVALAKLKKGTVVGPRWLPREVEKKWVKITVSRTGTFTGGKIFGAIVREDDLPYVAGQFIDKGAVQA